MQTFAVFISLALSLTASARVPDWNRDDDSFKTPTRNGGVVTLQKSLACAAIHKKYVSKRSTDSEATVLVKPSVALDCLKSIEVDTERDVEFIDYLLPFVEFQSTLAYLARPPSEYLIPGVDVVNGLLEIKSKLLEGSFRSQYDFTLELEGVIRRAKDGHLAFVLPLNEAFAFNRGAGGLISISEDGLSTPKVFLLDDLAKSRREGCSISDIKRIDRKPVLEYLETLSTLGSSQDPDALYNEVFDSIAKTGANKTGLFHQQKFGYLRDTTAIEFQNNTRIVFENTAVVVANFTQIDSPEALHKYVELPTPTSSTTTSTATSTTLHKASPTVKGYPYPVDKHFADWIAGYFLNDTEYRDIAVLALNGFVSRRDQNIDEEEDVMEFHRTLISFLSEFKRAGKKKLIIDLSDNRGGFGIAAVDLLYQLFPHITPIDSYRLRATATLDWIGNNSYQENAMLFGEGIDEKNRPYKNWDDIFGPDSFHGDDFTNLLATGLENDTWKSFQKDAVLAPGTLKPDDVIILTDSTCASACPLFTGWMQRLAGVRTVAIGGRPLGAPMQAMGGTKGGAVNSLDIIQQTILIALNNTDGLAPVSLELPSLQAAPLLVRKNAINMQNFYLSDDQTGTPLQFIYEAANCKLFYTAETALDITKMWQAVADVAWGGAKCVPGSTVNWDGTIGDNAPAFSPAVWSTAEWPVVAGGLVKVGGHNSTEAVKEVNGTKSGEQKRSDLGDGEIQFIELGPKPVMRRRPIII
ncbi:peptidase S41 family protein [Thelonectria olida]|uniref:Peptidase S41 family protein n=1 Tax=Thelonectria olida TaxID=1576542 RepID=A0A9P8VW35_9HYPO|nr:peptidase S41 family protein [Thelonectria olida]